ncbi:MAG: MMPL family transporter [Dehalococcoidia bacterium]
MASRNAANSKPPLLERWARFAHRRRGTVIGAWFAGLALLLFGMVQFGGTFSSDFTLPGSESQKAFDLLKAEFPARAAGEADLVFEANAGIDDPAIKTQIERTINEVKASPQVAEVESPYDNPAYIAEGGTIARAVIRFDVPVDDVELNSVNALLDTVDANNGNGLTVEVGGDAVYFNEQPAFGSEMLGMLAAVVILLIAFGSVVAMGLPVVSALFGLAGGFAIIALLANFFGFPDFSGQFAAMIGIGVGIDYSLLVVTRYREGLHTGNTVEESVVMAVTTAGKSVIFAGIVVALAFFGLFVMGLPFVAMLGTSGAIVVILAVFIALTVTPAGLSLVGHRIDSLKVPFLHQKEGVDETSMWYRLSRRIQRSPLPFAAVSGGLLLFLAFPLLTMDLGFTDAGNGSTDLHSRRAYDLLAKGFGPGFNGPILAVVDVSDGGPDTIDRAREAIGKDSNVDGVGPSFSNGGNGGSGNTVVFSIFPKTSPQDDKTTALVDRLRSDVVPAFETTGAHYYFAGSTAGNVDAAEQIQSRMPLLFVGVIGLSFLLLTAVFRSVVIALKAAIMNLLSIGAAYGVVVAIFQWGWGGSILGVDKGPVEVFLPMMMFAILFGLSMDYEVFLISRIREEYLRTGNTPTAVANGLTATARVITAAAAIMVSVFLAFVLGPDRIIKEFGIGLATAIFVDATIVRIFLVPAAMELLGDANWWMPSWLDRLLPHIDIEGPVERQPLPGASAGGK